MAEAILLSLEWGKTWFVAVFGVTNYESKLIIKNAK